MPAGCAERFDGMTARGVAVSPANLRVSYKTHLVMPYHKQEDAARESSSEGGAIGTTRRGIGPTYADKMQRATALRVADLLHEEKLRQRVSQIAAEKTGPKLPRGYFLHEPSPRPPATRLLLRGKATRPGPRVEPGMPAYSCAA